MPALRELIAVAAACAACGAGAIVADGGPTEDAALDGASGTDAPPPLDAAPDRSCDDVPDACSRAACAADPDRLGLTQRSGAGGETYVAYAPAGYDPAKLSHVVVALHGGFGSPGAAQAYLTGTWQSAADAEDFLVVAPETALDDAGSGYWSFGSAGADRVFAVLDDFRRCYSIDDERIIVGGFSSGGQAAYVLGLGQAAHFSGIAVTGADFLTSDGLAREAGLPPLVPAAWPIPISNFAGTSDPAASLNGAVIPGMDVLVDAGHPFFLHVFDGGHPAGENPAFARQMYLDLQNASAP